MNVQRQAGGERSEPAISVVLVDQHAMVREGLSRILAAEPDIAVVGSTGDGQEAARLTASLQPNVVILDAGLPDVTALTARLVAAVPTAGVKILSASDEAQQAVTLVCTGARGYLSTYATGQSLIEAVRAISRGELVLEATALKAVVGQLAHHKSGVVVAADAPYEILSALELEVLGLLCQGRSDKEIAQTLYLSVRTVNSHVSHIYAKLGVGTRTEAMHVALQHGLVDLATTPPTPAHQ
jgi:DNA-binding NarL/FixJ family response regulator